ncbi:MAG: hypothetical protein HPY66_2943 [Firmicutes bacterium]|nr:hypothetical protein [Bacillota bacterium]
MGTPGMCAALVLGVIAEYTLIRLMNNRGYAVPERTGPVLCVAAGLSCGSVGYLYSSIYLAVIYGVTLTVLLTAAVVDIHYREIPAFLYRAILCMGVINFIVNQNSIWSYAAGFLLSGLIFLGLALIGGMGGGDVKLIASLGLLFGYVKIICIMVITFLIGACAGCLLMLGGKVKMKDAIPLAPFVYAAVIITVIKL